MWRGTTPTHIFTFPAGVDPAGFDEIYITYEQDGSIVCEKSINDMEMTADGVVVTFTQAETLRFSPGAVRIQIRAHTADGTAVASNIISTTAREILKDGVI